jgi:hypothetical protein
MDDLFAYCFRRSLHSELVSFSSRSLPSAHGRHSCFYRNPVYHQLVFASIVFTVAFRITHTLKYSKASSGIPPETKTMIGKLFATGAALFALGFLIWNMDNTYCISLTDIKRTIGYPTAFLLEGTSTSNSFQQ